MSDQDLQVKVIGALKTVMDPDLHKNIVDLGFVKNLEIKEGRVQFDVELTTPACPVKEQLQTECQTKVKALDGVKEVAVKMTAEVRSTEHSQPVLTGVKNIIAVASGKGGVGKSTVSTNLAVALSLTGATVGLMDGDVYGPSIPTLTGMEGTTPKVRDNLIIPPVAGGVKIISIGFMVDRNQALIWRGPMTHGVIKQFLEQVDWGELDYLIVDLPPGTGDIPLTLAQSVPMTGSVVICTPQDVALLDARRAVKMYEQLNVPCIGIIENMSYYLCPKCGHRDELFDHGGAARMAAELNVPFLGEIPLNAKIRVYGDAGTPEKAFTDTDDFVSEAIGRVVANTAGQISIRSQLQPAAPRLSIE